MVNPFYENQVLNNPKYTEVNLESYFKPKSKKLTGTAYKKRVLECFQRDNYTCRQCDRQYTEDNHALSPHHIKKRSQGRDDSLDNLVSLCTFPCHRKVDDGLLPNNFKN